MATLINRLNQRLAVKIAGDKIITMRPRQKMEGFSDAELDSADVKKKIENKFIAVISGSAPGQPGVTTGNKESAPPPRETAPADASAANASPGNEEAGNKSQAYEAPEKENKNRSKPAPAGEGKGTGDTEE